MEAFILLTANKIKPDGILDNSFNFDPPSLPFSTWILSIIEKDEYYYIGGMNERDNVRYFISKLNQNGTIDSGFSYYSETDPELMLENFFNLTKSICVILAGIFLCLYLIYYKNEQRTPLQNHYSMDGK
ncbi:hypothetical protein ACM39_03245 [Chryseobacterium sp. FH2]|uniref:hypothetical protein n=1 Tax=Chryseobacterium sp. FH2 TaxID=1674291 RepID=UPI00065ADAE5|nr:hypothetical protein [Chryseobacterium sp. FH2]KMQ69141.1 hypothetical protein ACM39_03245 [Chryseobacterium sp. FH2]